MFETPHGQSAEYRKKLLELALKKSEAKKVKFPTVAMPQGGFRQKIKTGDSY